MLHATLVSEPRAFEGREGVCVTRQGALKDLRAATEALGNVEVRLVGVIFVRDVERKHANPLQLSVMSLVDIRRTIDIGEYARYELEARREHPEQRRLFEF